LKRVNRLSQVIPLLLDNLDLESLVTLCKASKQLQDSCLDSSDRQLQLIVQQALHQKQPRKQSSSRVIPADPGSCCNSLAWLLGSLAKCWGIMQLAARLDLKQALLAAEKDRLACNILIRAGARITQDLIRTSDSIMGLRAWADAYEQLRLSYPPQLHEVMQALNDETFKYTQLQWLDNELLYDLLRVALMTKDKPLYGKLISVLRKREWSGWSVERVFKLMVLAMKHSNGSMLLHLLQLPVAEHVTAQQYNHLLLLLLGHRDGDWQHSAAKQIIQRVQWDNQLVEEISAASRSQSACWFQCRICRLMQLICSSSAPAVPMLLQTSLLCAVTSSHLRAGCSLLRRIARYEGMTEAAQGYTAVMAALQSWPVEWSWDYCPFFKRLLRQPAVQQLLPGEVLQLLLQAAGSGCADGLRYLLRGLPAAQEAASERYQQLLDLAVGSGSYRERGRSYSKQRVVAVLLEYKSAAQVLPGPGQLHQLLLKCVEQHQSEVVKCLLGAFTDVAQHLSPAAVHELLLQAAQRGPGDCFSPLLELVPQLEEVPLEVLQELLPALMKHSCPTAKLTPDMFKYRLTYVPGSRSCSVCSLLKAAGGKLAAADVWEVLVAAAKAQGDSIHLAGLAQLPGVDDLGYHQVEQLLLAAIEGWKVPSFGEGRHWQWLVLKIEQLQGELLLAKQLPSAAVHRLMLACVERAGSGCVGELREELGLPTEGWEGPLSQQQLEQLLQVASARSHESAQGKSKGDAIECVLLMAKLLPSMKERQQMEDMLFAAGVPLVGEEHDRSSQE
jgi:hypothetical protein